MNPWRYIAATLALVSAVALAGCQSTGSTKTAENRITVNSGAYVGKSSALGGDIKSILMAGGLDVTNPSAPTNDTTKSEIAKSATSYNTDAMIAALSDTTTRTASAAQTLKPTTVDPVSESLAAPTVALAMVAEPKPKPKLAPTPVRQVVEETRIEVEKVQTIELASINLTPADDSEAFDPLPPKVEKPTTVAALPETKVAKSSRPASVDGTSASGKTSRVRRF
jgi:hypothetical protein